MSTSHQDDPYLSAMMAKWKSLCESLDDLGESIKRLERDRVCSNEVARAARREVDGCRDELGIFFGKTLLLHLGLRDAASSTKLLTQGEMLPILNELGYPVTASVLKRMFARNAGPPLANWGGKKNLYRLDEAITWAKIAYAKSHFNLAPAWTRT